VLALLEREVAVTRAGANARDGASAHHEVKGVAATAYDHWDSRAGDPQLHTHVVVSNKVRTVFDGGGASSTAGRCSRRSWRCRSTTTRVLADILRRSFGVEWEMRTGGEPQPGLRDRRVGEGWWRVLQPRPGDRDREGQLIERYERDHGERPTPRL
jgi:hypothetical protein